MHRRKKKKIEKRGQKDGRTSVCRKFALLLSSRWSSFSRISTIAVSRVTLSKVYVDIKR